MTHRAAVTAVGIAALLALEATSFADAKSEAKEHVARASAAHKEKRFGDALDELLVAYTLDPQPQLLYALAQTYVKLGKCTEAITYYQRFIDSKPRADQLDLAKQAIETCKTNPPEPETAAKPPEPPVVVAPPPPPPVIVVPPLPPPVHIPWFHDGLGDGLVIGGVVAAVTGAVLYAAATSDLDEHAKTYDAQQTLANRASTLRTLALVAGVAGGLAITGGIVRYMLRADEGPGISVSAHGGAVATWSGRF